MGLYQRRRPSPLKIVPDRVRRQESLAPSGTQSPESPDSPETPPGAPSDGLSSPDSPSPTASTFPSTSQAPPAQKETPSAVAPSTTSAVATSKASTTTPPPPPPPPPPSQSSTSSSAKASSTAVQSSAAEKASSTSQKTSSTSVVAAPAVSSEASSAVSSEATSTGTNAPASQITGQSSAEGTDIPSSTTDSVPSSGFTSQRNRPTEPTSFTSATNSQTGSTPAQSEVDGSASGVVGSPAQKSQKQDGAIMSKGAEAALITFAVLGFLALAIGGFIFMKRRRRRRSEYNMRHAEDAFDPNNSGSLHAPETAHIGFDLPGPHITQSSSNSNSLFGGSFYQRPETVSTNDNQSRIQPPQPTPNPFADPPLHKAYDQLRGRPRSTTLTDRGSWIKNPFKDPGSDRFDPFGELQEKARMERVRYMKEVKREEEERKRREHEQEFLEKERMGLGVPDPSRKGSGVTIEGLGVLDRSGSGGYR